MERRRGFMVEERERLRRLRGSHGGMSGGDYGILVKLREKRRRDHIWFLENEEDG